MKKITFALSDQTSWDLKQISLAEQQTQRELITKLIDDFISKYRAKNNIPACPYVAKK